MSITEVKVESHKFMEIKQNSFKQLVDRHIFKRQIKTKTQILKLMKYRSMLPYPQYHINCVVFPLTFATFNALVSFISMPVSLHFVHVAFFCF